MKKKIERNYLEINSIKELKETNKSSLELVINLVDPPDFQLNKFFYKNVGKKHHWIDRLVWDDKKWIEYVCDEKIKTYTLKIKNEFAGYFELIFHKDLEEVEIAYLGLLEEYHNQKLGSQLLTIAIKNSFELNPKRVWVHTCSLDHENALKNYLARGMKIFKRETISV